MKTIGFIRYNRYMTEDEVERRLDLAKTIPLRSSLSLSPMRSVWP